AYFPNLHVYVASFSELTGTPPAVSLFLAVGSALVACLPIAYRLSFKLLQNRRAALLTTVILAASYDFQIWAKYATPFSLGFALALAAVWQLVEAEQRARRLGLVTFLVASVTLIHVLASALLVVTVFLMSISTPVLMHRTP